ncbi:MAG: GDSL-type esterase/lipase family protein [Chthoniobacteraceae bacterium]|jgi:lysophospholipase L1-like esterase
MKTPLPFLLLALIAAGPLAAQQPLSPAPIDPAKYHAPIKVACIRDSITHGAGAPNGQSYPDQLQTMLGSGWQVRNFGVSSRTLLKKGDYPYMIEKAFQDAQQYQPDVVIIMLGTNDTKPQNWVFHDDFYADYRSLIAAFANLPGKPRIYICRPCPVPAPGNFGITEVNIQIEIPIIDRLAAEENLGEIDMHAALVNTPELQPDHVHPNAAGAHAMAAAAYKALTGKAPAN